MPDRPCIPRRTEVNRVTDGGEVSPKKGESAPAWALPMALVYLAVLVGCALLYARQPTFHRWLPNPLGPIPLGVVWWGSLGGVAISLSGIISHARSWDKGLETWHIAHPVMGAVMGSVGYLILIVVIRGATGSSVTSPTAIGHAEFDLVAFILGFRQRIFWELLKRASDVLLSPGGPGASTRKIGVSDARRRTCASVGDIACPGSRHKLTFRMSRDGWANFGGQYGGMRTAS